LRGKEKCGWIITAEEEIQVFADGSALEGKVGAAAILLRTGKPTHSLHFHLSKEKEHTAHEAELVGILLGLHLISTEKRGGTTFALGCDNQAAIKVFHSNLRNPGHHLAWEALRIAHQIQNSKKKTKYALTIRWTAGHEGIEGNEIIDREAKKVAEGHSSDAKLLPTFLRKTLLMNPSAVKRAYNNHLKNMWDNTWWQSKRGSKMHKADTSTLSNKFLKSISIPKLTCGSASLMSQFRLTHILLNSYLFRFKRADSARCPTCRADEESIAHFLLFCPSYAHERWALARQAKKNSKSLSLESLLGEPHLVIPLANFINATHRFSEHGEHSINQTQLVTPHND
jgi:ribonuclease HI